MRRLLLSLVLLVGCADPPRDNTLRAPIGGAAGAASEQGGALNQGGRGEPLAGAADTDLGSAGAPGGGEPSSAGSVAGAGDEATAGAAGEATTTTGGGGAAGSQPSGGFGGKPHQGGGGAGGAGGTAPVQCHCYDKYPGKNRYFCVPFENTDGFVCVECGSGQLDCDGDTVEPLIGSSCEVHDNFCPP